MAREPLSTATAFHRRGAVSPFGCPTPNAETYPPTPTHLRPRPLQDVKQREAERRRTVVTPAPHYVTGAQKAREQFLRNPLMGEYPQVGPRRRMPLTQEWRVLREQLVPPQPHRGRLPAGRDRQCYCSPVFGCPQEPSVQDAWEDVASNGPGRRFSPRHRMPFDSSNAGSKCVGYCGEQYLLVPGAPWQVLLATS